MPDRRARAALLALAISALPAGAFAQPAPEPPPAPAAPPPAAAEPQVAAPAPAPRLPDAPAAPGAPIVAAEPEPPPRQSGFAFGSYGRMIAATDFRGRPGRDANIVAHGSRLDEGNYVELEFRRDDYWKKTKSSTRLVATLAVASPVFHYNGEFDAKIAIRNLYLEERDLGVKDLSVWAGSRMYRGDDIYLLNWWPLDNLNTMGGGARYDFTKNTFAALHFGMGQPLSGFYGQTVNRPAVFNQVGATSVKVLDRQRLIASVKVSHIIRVGEGGGGLKAVAYGEGHQLPAGQRESSTPQVFETLPSDGGYVIGAQFGGFTGQRDTHVNLYVRYARGLAAYDNFATPTQLGLDKTTSGAHEIVGAVGANWEFGPVGVMFGGYVRSFRNASAALDFDDVDEGIVALRPHVFFGEIGGLAVEGSYQAQQRGVQGPVAADGTIGASPSTARIWRFGVIPFLSPAGRGNFARPQFRVIYTLAARNDSAKALYPQDDVSSLRSLEHFFGFGAEWWFNSSSYGN